MAVRRPLYKIIDSSTSTVSFREMSDSHIDAIKKRMKGLYLANPSVSLSYVASEGNLNPMYDTRLVAGNRTLSNVELPTDEQTENVTQISVTNQHIEQTVATDDEPEDTNFRKFPVYYDAGNIRCMSLQDMYDTFVYDVINGWTDASSTAIAGLKAGGESYTIHTQTASSGYEAVSENTVYLNTTADIDAYDSTDLADTETDKPTDSTDTENPANYFYLLKSTYSANYVQYPIVFTQSGALQHLDTDKTDDIMEAVIRYAVQNVTGFKLRYQINGTGNNCGSNMVDTRFNSSQFITYSSAGDFRAQEVPAGIEQTINTYNLTVENS